jgi:hypothetical protein
MKPHPARRQVIAGLAASPAIAYAAPRQPVPDFYALAPALPPHGAGLYRIG